jgi:uncharacterized membrane protein
VDLRFIDARHTQTVTGILLRVVLIVFALNGVHHLLRIIEHPPSYSDLYPVWLGSRELLVNRHNPYSEETSREIQTAFYGAPLGPGEHPDHECCFAYPVYVSFLLAPGVNNDFAKVRLAALWLLVAATAISIACWHNVARQPVAHLLFVIPLALVSPPVMQGLDFRQAGMLVAALLSVAAVLTDRRKFLLAGMALALATIKPQMSLLPITWMLLWAGHSWVPRKNLIVGFTTTMAILAGAGELLLPGWISSFVAQIRLYRHFAGASILELLYGRPIGLALSAILICGLLGVMWKRRTASDFVPTLAFVLAIEVFVMPGLKSLLNLVLLMPGIFILLTKYPVTRERLYAQPPPQAAL